MTTESPTSQERSIAQQGQEKFEFYLLSLVFTLLALAVQTAVFGAGYLKNAIELTGWIAFTISGVIGLYRLQWIPVARNVMADLRFLESEIFELQKLQLSGESELLIVGTNQRQQIEERIGHRQSGVDEIKPKLESLERKIRVCYVIHTWAFVFGLAFIIAARALDPIRAIVAHIRGLG